MTTIPRSPAAAAPALLASIARRARGMEASRILTIAAEIRALQAAGKPVCDLTVGDFDPALFPVPDRLTRETIQALERGETNYPPGDGMPVLRDAIREAIRREHGVAIPRDGVLVTSGSRPVLYAAFQTLLDPGDRVVYGVPSWNNRHYTYLAGGTPVELPTTREDGFQPTAARLAPHLAEAKLLCLCTPSNPTGTVLDPEELARILAAVVEENAERAAHARPFLFVLLDQVYRGLVFGGRSAPHPAALCPEAAPYVIYLDGISKAFAATGLRVGWCTGAPVVLARMRDLLAHVGTWAPRPEQLGTAAFLADAEAVDTFRATFTQGVESRLRALRDAIHALRAEGFPVDCVEPGGAIYLAAQFDLVGRRLNGEVIPNNEAIRRLLLERAGWAAVPFQAFGVEEETGWFRLSVGAVTLDAIADAVPRIRAMLAEIGSSE